MSYLRSSAWIRSSPSGTTISHAECFRCRPLASTLNNLHFSRRPISSRAVMSARRQGAAAPAHPLPASPPPVCTGLPDASNGAALSASSPSERTSLDLPTSAWHRIRDHGPSLAEKGCLRTSRQRQRKAKPWDRTAAACVQQALQSLPLAPRLTLRTACRSYFDRGSPRKDSAAQEPLSMDLRLLDLTATRARRIERQSVARRRRCESRCAPPSGRTAESIGLPEGVGRRIRGVGAFLY
jgi:hypothetical protein